MLDALTVTLKRFLAIEPVHRFVECFVRLTQIQWHHVRIIEITKTSFGMIVTRIEDRLRKVAHFSTRFFIGIRPREWIVNDTDRIPVVALQSSSNVAEPCHMHARGDKAKIKKISVRYYTNEVTWNDWRL